MSQILYNLVCLYNRVHLFNPMHPFSPMHLCKLKYQSKHQGHLSSQTSAQADRTPAKLHKLTMMMTMTRTNQNSLAKLQMPMTTTTLTKKTKKTKLFVENAAKSLLQT